MKVFFGSRVLTPLRTPSFSASLCVIVCLYRLCYGPIPGAPLSTKGRDPGNLNNGIAGSYLTEKLISPCFPVFHVRKDLAVRQPGT